MSETNTPAAETIDWGLKRAITDDRLDEIGRAIQKGETVPAADAQELHDEISRARAAAVADLPKFENTNWSRKKLDSMERWLLASGLNPAQLRVVRALATPVDRLSVELAVAKRTLEAHLTGGAPDGE